MGLRMPSSMKCEIEEPLRHGNSRLHFSLRTRHFKSPSRNTGILKSCNCSFISGVNAWKLDIFQHTGYVLLWYCRFASFGGEVMSESGHKIPAFKKALRDEGIIAFFRNCLLHAAPPLITSEPELRDAFARVGRALKVFD